MKRIFCILLVLITAIIPLYGCNSTDNSDHDSTESGALIEDNLNAMPDRTEEPTYVISREPPTVTSISINSLEELSQMRELLSCTNQQELEISLMEFGLSTIEELSEFLETVDSAPYLNILDGNITWISHQKYVDHSILYITTTSENGDWVRVTYMLGLEDSSYWAYAKVNQANSSVISNPIKSEDKRVTLLSEVRKKHPVYPGRYVEWIGFVDGIGVEILYYAANISGINSNSLLSSLTISSLAPNDTVDPTLIEQITEGMTYNEVTEILGTSGTDVSSDAILFEYYLTDGRAAQIEFQKLNETDDLNDFTVKSITVE